MSIMSLFIVFTSFLFAQGGNPVVFAKADAVVWSPVQEIRGEASGFEGRNLVAYHNGDSFKVKVTPESTFSFELKLQEQENDIWFESRDGKLLSDTLDLDLAYNPAPIVEPHTEVRENRVFLESRLIENLQDEEMELIWSVPAGNPAATKIVKGKKPWVEIPAVDGAYFFDLAVVAGKDTTQYQTMVTRKGKQVKSFDFDESYPKWMDKAVIYEITPYAFVKEGTFNDITKKLPEIRSLGINTIWLQPIFPTKNGWQGYDVLNYRKVNAEFGTEEDLRELISKAKELEMRVLFDVVYNHSSIGHRYAKDRIKNGEKSHYYNFYQHEDDGKPYSSNYTQDEHGFINYFWPELVNLNYNNEEVQRWILESAKYWIREFDIDGYRLDAIWGVNSRNPDFAERLRREIKSVKPDFLLLAESKGSNPEVFDLGYDAAYDWASDTTWVSQWSWEYEYDEKSPKTIFNHPDLQKRSELLKQALFDNGGNMEKRLYHLENNDLPSFIKAHGLKRTKMAAGLLFAMPGIPMLYNGQEIGFKGHPYATSAYFERNKSIKSLDSLGLFEYYQDLIKIHKSYPALEGTEMAPVTLLGDGPLVGFHRWDDTHDFIVVVNLGEEEKQPKLALNKSLQKAVDREGRTYFKDLLSDKEIPLDRETTTVKVPMEGYTIRWLLLVKEPEKIK